MSAYSRRSFLKHACVAACACGASFSMATDRRATGVLMPLPRGDVQLGEGPMLQQFKAQQALYMGMDDDVLLKPFRQRAGLPAPGADMGGWYDDSRDFHIDPNDWGSANWHGFIPGHSFGQYVSALARGFAMTQDETVRRKVSDLVGKYAETISKRFFEDYNLPAYTYDKLAIGLIDAHQFAEVNAARPALAKLTESVLPFLYEKALTREERRQRPYQREAQIWDEPYTLPENLFIAHRLGMGPDYQALATRYLQDGALFDPLAEGRSPFRGRHAYSHVNALSSAVQAYAVTGNVKYFKAAQNGFAFVQAQSWATGGWGPNEELLAPDDEETLFAMLKDTHRSFETPCGAYGHFKIARSLLQITKDPRYGDSMERVLYNTILGALPTRPNGDTFYYSDYNGRANKAYRGEAWPCCSGTFAQITADYGISSYLTEGATLYVNLYVPSRARLVIDGQEVIVTQKTNYPAANSSRITVDLEEPVSFGIALRIPAWAGPATQVKLNGKPLAVKAGTFFVQTREWKHGDRLEIVFDMPSRLEPLNAAHPDMVALLNGPRVLFPIDAPDTGLTRADLLAARQRKDDTWGAKTAAGELRFKPFAAIDGETYRLYSQVKG